MFKNSKNEVNKPSDLAILSNYLRDLAVEIYFRRKKQIVSSPEDMQGMLDVVEGCMDLLVSVYSDTTPTNSSNLRKLLARTLLNHAESGG